MRNLRSRLLFHWNLLINRLLTSASVLINGIVFNRSNGSMIKCLIACKGSYNVKKYFKEIKRLVNLQKAETYLEPKLASAMELFCEHT